MQTPNFLYDLSNPHFENTTILTNDGQTHQGQFVQFKVVEDEIEYLYPSEKYCFLPKEFYKRFWSEYERHKGEFTTFPTYVLQISM